ncbi:hypothetical protein F4679DRAFT_561015 [Xylaria curta]|nr:hypothetical protein F4679DRAFT_561015 [Xylaria curta]
MSDSVDDERDPYLLHLKSKGKYESWMECLRGGDTDYLHTIPILDITALGEIRQWDNKDDLSTQLEEREFTDGTRLIIFDQEHLKYVQDHIGAMYDVDPVFFRAVKMNCDEYGYYTGVDHRVPEFLVGGRPQHLDLGYGWACAIHRKGNCNIVLLSASYSHSASYKWFEGRKVYAEIKLSQEYLKALCKLNKHFFVGVYKNPLLLLLPALETHAVYLYDSLIHTNRIFRIGKMNRKEKPELVEEAWSALRMMKHDGMGPLDCVRQYDSDHNGYRIQGSEEYKNLVERFGCIEREIARTEALARDYLQHHVGMFSLEESRASIKQAKIALEESKRTKLITVLAIFFVPISLSTSVFGMNIHELNENGQSLWVFILTTVLIVAATMIIWGFMYQLQKYNSLPKDRSKIEGEPWSARSAALCQLVFRGHIIWAWKSGIFLSLLSNGRVGFLRSCTKHTRYYNAEGQFSPVLLRHSTHWPCDYVRDHIGDNDEAFDCSQLEDQPSHDGRDMAE